jgi:hypothetical protein
MISFVDLNLYYYQLTVLSDDDGDAQLLFLGSRIGDSLLLQYTAAADDRAPQQNGTCQNYFHDLIKYYFC